MGRLKNYDRVEVTQKAMHAFWRNGYHATSTKQLANEMGVNVYSLFAEFESKQGLFEAALELYGREVVTAIFAELDTPNAGLNELKSVLNLQAAAAKTGQNAQGCFYCNTASERGAEDSPSRIVFGAHVSRIHKIVERALQNALNTGDLAPSTSCHDLSALIVTTFQGMSVLARARVNPDMILATVRALNDNLDRLIVTPN